MLELLGQLLTASVVGVVIGAISNNLINKSKIKHESMKWDNEFATTYARMLVEEPEVAKVLSRQFAAGLLIVKDSEGNTFEKYFIPMQCKLSIGRGDNNDIRFDHETVSRDHAVVYFSNGSIYCRDLLPLNPTCINGKPIKKNQKQKLKCGDILTVGPESIEYRSLL